MNDTKIDDGGAAFPHGPLGGQYHGEDGYSYHQSPANEGMTLRELYAALAVPGIISLLANDTSREMFLQQCAEKDKDVAPTISRLAFELADAMIRESKRR